MDNGNKTRAVESALKSEINKENSETSINHYHNHHEDETENDDNDVIDDNDDNDDDPDQENKRKFNPTDEDQNDDRIANSDVQLDHNRQNDPFESAAARNRIQWNFESQWIDRWKLPQTLEYENPFRSIRIYRPIIRVPRPSWRWNRFG